MILPGFSIKKSKRTRRDQQGRGRQLSRLVGQGPRSATPLQSSSTHSPQTIRPAKPVSVIPMKNRSQSMPAIMARAYDAALTLIGRGAPAGEISRVDPH
jgi:hypothetical protein